MSIRPRTIALLGAASLAVPVAAAHAQATDGSIVSVAGTTSGFAGDGGPATDAKMNTPSDVAFLTDDSFVIADFGNDRIRQVLPDGTITTVAGNDRGFSGDNGPAQDADLDRPRGVTAFPGGGYLIADTFNHRIRRVLPDGTIITVAGSVGGIFGDGGPASAAGLLEPSDTAMLPDGGFLIADTGNDRIRRVLPDGTITTVQVNGTLLSGPRDVAVASDGAYLVADTDNNRILRIAADGSTITLAGGGGQGLDGDGDPGRLAKIDHPFSVTALPNNGFLFADTNNDRVRRITPLNAIFTVAGTTEGESGNGGPAKAAQLDHPVSVTLAPGGGFLVADSDNMEIRRVSDVGAIPPAVAGRSVGVAPATGDVTVKPAGLALFFPLAEQDLVPVGSEVDATKGHISIVVAKDAGGEQLTAEVFDAPFRVVQGTAAQPFTNFRIASLEGCATARSASRATIAAKKKRRKKKKSMWVREKGGKWRSSSGGVTASAVGTEWNTTLFCDGTRVTVREGSVRVRDKARNRTTLVQAGQSLFVKAKPGRGGL